MPAGTHTRCSTGRQGRRASQPTTSAARAHATALVQPSDAVITATRPRRGPGVAMEPQQGGGWVGRPVTGTRPRATNPLVDAQMRMQDARCRCLPCACAGHLPIAHRGTGALSSTSAATPQVATRTVPPPASIVRPERHSRPHNHPACPVSPKPAHGAHALRAVSRPAHARPLLRCVRLCLRRNRSARRLAVCFLATDRGGGGTATGRCAAVRRPRWPSSRSARRRGRRGCGARPPPPAVPASGSRRQAAGTPGSRR